MARNDSFNQPWASVPAQFERPGDGLIARGWAGGASEDPPEAKWENWWHNRVDLALQELQNLGQLLWFADAPYQAGARVNHGGNSYISLSNNTGVEPTGVLDFGVWRKEDPGTYLQTANNLSEIAAAGPEAIAAAIANLGISDNLIPVGIPLPWPIATPPAGWIKCNGNSFSTTAYPTLATVYPGGVLPDLRGEFIRGWDDGRGVDVGRVLMSHQGDAIRNITGQVSSLYRAAGTISSGALSLSLYGPTPARTGTLGADIGDNASINFNASGSGVPTASENRPRNIAFNYIVRAA
jgi:Phage Tail Collar Domain